MTIIRNINLDQLLLILSGIKLETDIVDMEVNDEEKTIVFIPVKLQEENPETNNITDQIKKIKEDYEKNKNSTNVPVHNSTSSSSPKLDLTNLNKLI